MTGAGTVAIQLQVKQSSKAMKSQGRGFIQVHQKEHPASRTSRRYISIVLSPMLCGTLLEQLQETNLNGYKEAE